MRGLTAREAIIPLMMRWPWRSARAGLGLVFTESSILAVRDSNAHHLTVSKEIPAGLANTSPVEPNFVSVSQVAQLAAEAAEELDARRLRACIVLPDLALTTIVHQPDAGGLDGARKALMARLPFPAEEARIDFWQGVEGEVLGAGIREAIIRQYEQIAEAAAGQLGWVDAASLVRIPEWAADRKSDEGLSAELILYDCHYAIVVFEAARLVDVRSKLRPAGDFAGAVAELGRLAALHHHPNVSRVVVSGDQAGPCAAALASSGTIEQVAVARDSESELLASCASNLLSRT